MRLSFGLRAFGAALVFFPALMDLSNGATAADAPLMAVPGHFAVSPAGAATYSVPIAVPPGTAGMVPSVSLNYSSQSQDGIVGWGWTLNYGPPTQGHGGSADPRAGGRQPASQQQGQETSDNGGNRSYAPASASGALAGGGDVGMITRCPQTIAQDGVHGGLNYDGNDRFCLNGQRLVLVPGTGGYGTNGSEYRTEIETFAKITAQVVVGTGFTSFIVLTKGGLKLEFGATPDSQVIATGLTTPRAWALDKVTDTKGNYFTISYITDTANAEIYPQYINYTGNAGLPPYNKVEFDYAPRSDETPYYQAGFKQQFAQRLSEIKTWQGTAVVLDYKLAYRAGTALLHSRLTSVTECDSSGTTCLPPTTFDWQGGTGTVGFTSIPLITVGGPVLTADFDGDGLADISVLGGGPFGLAPICYSGTPTGDLVAVGGSFPCPPHLPGGALFEFTGDGLIDEFGFISSIIELNTGSSFTGFVTTPPFYNYHAADFDGDGRADFYAESGSAPSGHPELWHGNGDGTFTPEAAPYANWTYPDIADFDGDGCADVLYGDRNLVGPLPDSAISFSCMPKVASIIVHQPLGEIADGSNNGAMADFNGDGKTDLVIGGVLYLSTGTGFVSTGFNMSTIGGAGSAGVADFNGDGRMDIATGGTSGVVSIYLSTGTGFVLGGTLTVGTTGTSTPYTCRYTSTTLVGDADGDGAGDYCSVQDGLQFLTIYKPETVTAIHNGIGATVNVAYDRLNKNAPFYTKGSGATYPTQDIDNAMYVVAQVDASNGLSANSCSALPLADCLTTTYAYGGAKADLSGRGFLGFTTVTATDSQTGIKQTTTYRTDFPFVGEVAAQTAVTTHAGSGCIAGVTLKSVANSYSSTLPTGSPFSHFVFLTRSDVTGADCDGTALPPSRTDYTYDAYGNPTTLSQTTYVATIGGTVSSTSVTTNTFAAPDLTHWLFLLISTATTNTVGPSAVTRTASYDYLATTDFLDQQIVEPSSTTLKVQTDYTLDPVTGVATDVTVTASHALTRETHFGYDSQFRFVISTANEDPVTHTLTRFEHFTNEPGFGGLASHTDLNSLVTAVTYDGFGRQTYLARPDGTAVSTQYNVAATCAGALASYGITCAAGNTPLSTDTPVIAPGLTQNGPQVTHAYDALLRPIATLQQTDTPTSTWSITNQVYDANGRVLKASRPFFPSATVQWTAFAYDDLGRVKTATAPNGGVTSNVYTGLVSTVTNPLGQVTTFTKNPQGLNASVTDALGHPTSYVYDAFGNLTGLTDPAGHVTSYSYDLRGNKLSSSDPDMGNWSYSYDGLGRLLTQSDALGQPTSLTYELFGRVASRTEPGLTSTWTYDTAANGMGLEATATTSAGYSRTMAYDAKSRPLSATQFIGGGNQAYGYAYDTVTGQLDTLTYPSGFVAKYVYTSLGYLSQIKDNASGVAIWTANARDAEMHTTQSTAANGVVTTDTYDPQTGLMTSVRAGPSGGVAAFDYLNDLAGNLTYRADVGLTPAVKERFCYDPLNRLTQSALAVGSDPGTNCAALGGTVTTIAYDALGNITSKTGIGTYAYGGSGGPHAVSSITGTVNGVTNPTYTYDANGNMLSGAGRAVTYTAFNMVATITQGASTYTWTYDDQHRRIRGQSRIYVNDPVTGALSEMTGGKQNKTWYDYVQAEGRIVAELTRMTPSGFVPGPFYFVTDSLGSISVVTDSTGAVVERDAYDPWGKRRNPATGVDDPACGTAPPSVSSRGYTGHEHIDVVCLINENARVYDPAIGRFMSADDLVADVYNDQSLNRYTYVDNGPLTLTDPTGHDPQIAFTLRQLIMAQCGTSMSCATNLITDKVGVPTVIVLGVGVVVVAAPAAAVVAPSVVEATPFVADILAGDSLGGASAIPGVATVLTAAQRASELAGTMGTRTAEKVTIAVTETEQGTRVISSSEGLLRPATRAALLPGEIAPKGVRGAHAEINGINGARQSGLTPTGTAASRPICPSCAKALEGEGVTPLSPLKGTRSPTGGSNGGSSGASGGGSPLGSQDNGKTWPTYIVGQ